MKSGIAVMMVALDRAKGLKLKGDVILSAVADEEMNSIGTEQLIAAGWRADAALVAEPTEMDIVHHHKGYTLFEVDIHGSAAHGSRPDLGVDAVCKAGHFLVELDRHAQELKKRFEAAEVENSVGNIHVGTIKGGEEVNSYPARCNISIEHRTVGSEPTETVKEDLLKILTKLSRTVPDFKFDLRTTFARSPFSIARDHEFVKLVAKHAATRTGREPSLHGAAYWTDMALLADAGVPGLVWGPNGFGLHAKTEWVEIKSLHELLDSYVAIAAEFCK